MAPPRSPLDDPQSAAFAWERYRRLMKFMGLVTTLTVAAAMGFLYHAGALVSIHFVIATALGIGAAMMLMAALMGLVFLSHGTGHDAAVASGADDDEPEYRGRGRGPVLPPLNENPLRPRAEPLRASGTRRPAPRRSGDPG